MLRNRSGVSDDEVAMPQGVLSTAHLCDADAVILGGKAAETQFRALLDVLPAAIYVTDANGRITYYNQAAVDLAGRRPELAPTNGASAGGSIRWMASRCRTTNVRWRSP